MKVALLVACVAIMGSFIGAYTANYISGNVLRKVFALVLLAVSLKMLLK